MFSCALGPQPTHLPTYWDLPIKDAAPISIGFLRTRDLLIKQESRTRFQRSAASVPLAKQACLGLGISGRKFQGSSLDTPPLSRTPNQTTCNLLRSGRQIAVSTVEPVTELDRCRCVVMQKDQESNKGTWAVGGSPAPSSPTSSEVK